MIYYEHHLGDYARDTNHLSMLEDAAYRRLLDVYYGRERPLPAEVKECCKLARAQSKQERDAVAYVLKEFFEVLADGHHQARADREIARYLDKQAKAKRSAEARWKSRETTCQGNANASADAMRTHTKGNALQSPITNNQSPEEDNPNPSASATPPHKPVSREVPADPDWLLDFKLAYPKRAGDQGWRKAMRAASARFAEGHTVDELIAGAKRYAAFCTATGKTNTEYVKQACTFLGPDKFFLQPWTLPTTKAEAHQQANVDASLEWLRQQEEADAAH